MTSAAKRNPGDIRVARIYMRVSTDTQDLQRQERLKEDALAAGYYVAGVSRETASGARADRPELLRMIHDLQPNDIVIAERIDRISRLPLPDAELLIDAIRSKGERLAAPGVVVSAHTNFSVSMPTLEP